MHRLSVHALVGARSYASLAPRTPGARHVVLDGDRFVFVSRGHLMAEPVAGGAVEVLDPGTVDRVWGAVASRDGTVIGQRIDARGVPPRPKTVDFTHGGPSVAAQTFGLAARAPIAVAVDVLRGDVHVLDLAARTTRTVATVPTRQSIELPGLVSVADDGSHAFITVAAAAHGDASLMEVDLRDGTARVVHPPLASGSLVGCRWGKRVVVIEQALGDEPRLRVLVDGKVLIARDGLHPLATPVPLSDAHLLLLAVPKPDPVSGSGDSELCVLDASGTLVALAPASGASIRVEGRSAIVEDGRTVTRVELSE